MHTPHSVILALLVAAASSGVATAHEGPPFEIINEARAPYRISVWTDPDIGTGTFFVVLEPLEEGPFEAPASVYVQVAPASAPDLERKFAAESQRVRYGGRYYTEVPFDSGGFWDVRVTIDARGRTHEVRARVEATPDGTIGPIGLLVYVLPFLAVGYLWVKAYLRRRRDGRPGEEQTVPPGAHAA